MNTKSIATLVFSSAIAGCGAFEGWPTYADYLRYCENRKNIPKDWKWEPEGNWYRSPDGKTLWLNGDLIPSIQDKDCDIEDIEILRKGDHRYSPTYIRKEKEAFREQMRAMQDHRMFAQDFTRRNDLRRLNWQPRHYNTRLR